MANKSNWAKGGATPKPRPSRSSRAREAARLSAGDPDPMPVDKDQKAPEVDGDLWWVVVTNRNAEGTRYGPWSRRPIRTVTDGLMVIKGDSGTGDPELTIVLDATLTVIAGDSSHFDIEVVAK